MKKLITLLSIPLIALGLSRCAPKEPVKEDYNKGYALINAGPYINALVKDFDKDGLADAIVSNSGFAIFYVKGYEDKAQTTKSSVEMTPEIRKSASDFIKAENSLSYETAKVQYERRKVEYDSSKAKIEVMNKAMEKH